MASSLDDEEALRSLPDTDSEEFDMNDQDASEQRKGGPRGRREEREKMNMKMEMRRVKANGDARFALWAAKRNDPPSYYRQLYKDKWWFPTFERYGGLQVLVSIHEKRESRSGDGGNHPYPRLRSFVESLRFEVMMGVVIVGNAVLIGMEVPYTSDPTLRPAGLAIAEHTFTFTFTVELILRIVSASWVWLFNFYNFLDFLLVVVPGFVGSWFLEPMGVSTGWLRVLTCLRVLRLVRLVSAVRTIAAFRELWLLVKGLTDSARMIFWTCVIIGAVHFMFGIAFVEIVGKAPENLEDPYIQERFGKLFTTMLSLFQVMTLDSWAGSIARPLLGSPLALVLLFIFLGLSAMVLFNLVTAVIVEHAFEAAKQDEELVANQKSEEKERTLVDLQRLFRDLDEDGSGELSREEFTEVLDDPKFVQRITMLDIDVEDLPDIFDIFDDGDGTVDSSEFCSGMLDMQAGVRAKDVHIAVSHLRLLLKAVHHSQDTYLRERVNGPLNDILEDTLPESCELTQEALFEAEAAIANIQKVIAGRVSFELEPLLPSGPSVPAHLEVRYKQIRPHLYAAEEGREAQEEEDSREEPPFQ